MKNSQSSLPPGFRFHPTDEELILHYLRKKLTSTVPFPVSIIADVDIYKFDPWDLPAKATFGEKEWYFFSPRDRKYPNGARPNRAAASGYWKATGTDKAIVASSSTMAAGDRGVLLDNIGVKKALVFYKGRPPKGIKTNWIMHEYRLAETSNPTLITNKPTKLKDSSMRLDNWVLCRIYKKSNVFPPTITTWATSDQEQEEEVPLGQDVILPSLKSHPGKNTLKPQRSSSFSNLLDAMDYSILSHFLSDGHCDPDPTIFESSPSLVLNRGSTLDQSFFSNCTNGGSSSNNLLQNLPQLKSSVSIMDNRVKRQHSNNIDDDMLYPSKKLISSFNFTSSTNQSDIPQFNLINQPFLNQQLLLSPHLQFQG
ncbi:hypothetical protein L1049_009100 [Liquidambar formosana]|uniref:NAC domain-containing protein n=1 Tax=Liquidambar formosana TaxID=63359 RepID=A0AAP0X4Z9_LIQFO